jgi:hypothetical protein
LDYVRSVALDQDIQPLYTAPPAASLREQEAVRAGWNACLRNLFSLTEQTGDEATAREPSDFMRGRAHEAKGIARAMNGFGPEHCEDLSAFFDAQRLGRGKDGGNG